MVETVPIIAKHEGFLNFIPREVSCFLRPARAADVRSLCQSGPMTSPAARVLHTGQALVDLVVEVPALPARGTNVMAHSATRYAGGAVTTLVAAARDGASCVLAGSVGTGPLGELVRATLAEDAVTISSPPVPDRDTAECVVLVESGGQRTFVTTRAAERDITAASLATSAPVAGDLVCVSGYTLLPPTRDPLLTFLHDVVPDAARVVLDPGDALDTVDPEALEAVLARTHVWTSNADEARALTGADDVEGACRAVAERLPDDAVVVVRDGPRGCHVRHAGTTVAVPGFARRAVDTNGAGDTHTGVLCAGAAAGLAWVDAALRANAAGALTVTRRGPTSAPTRPASSHQQARR